MCHSRHTPRIETPPARRDPALRASDADRESAVTELREHGASGRLDVEELEQRVGAAYGARTHGDLAALLADLPAARRTAAAAPRTGHGHGHRWHGHDWSSFVAINALLVVIWAATGADYFWPGWVMVWWAFALVMRSAPRLRLR